MSDRFVMAKEPTLDRFARETKNGYFSEMGYPRGIGTEPIEVNPKNRSQEFAYPGEDVIGLVPGQEARSYKYKIEDPTDPTGRYFIAELQHIVEALNRGWLPDKDWIDRKIEALKSFNFVPEEEKEKLEEIQTAIQTAEYTPANKKGIMDQFKQILGKVKNMLMRKEAVSKLQEVAAACEKLGYKTAAHRLLVASVNMSEADPNTVIGADLAHPHQKEHMIPSIEALHQYFSNPQDFMERLSKLQRVYEGCAGIVTLFQKSYKADLEKASSVVGGEAKAADSLQKLVGEADGMIDRKIDELKKIIPSHPTNK